MKVSAKTGNSIPKSIASQGSFDWFPVDVGRHCAAVFQIESYRDWVQCATRRQIYNVTSPDLAKARLFAAHLVNIHQLQTAATIEWAELRSVREDEDTGAVYQRLLAKELDPTLIVVVLDKLTKLQREIARDIMAAYPKVPVIVVASETTPIDLAKFLYSPVHRVAHIQTSKRISV